MSLHGLLSVTIGVPNVEETAAYYAEFGLAPEADGVVQHPRRRPPAPAGVRVHPAADRPSRRSGRRRRPSPRRGQPRPARRPGGPAGDQPGGDRAGHWRARRPGRRPADPAGPGARHRLQRRPARPAGRPGARPHPPGPGTPRKLGHAVLGSTDPQATMSFFTDGLGFKISDRIKGVGAFMRCSTDHHNVLVLAAPVSFLHHTSWQVDDVDDVGRGACAMLEGPSGTSGASAATTRDRTSSGTSRTRRATSPSTTPTWTASSRTSCGRRRTSRAPAACSPGNPAAALVHAPGRPGRHDDRSRLSPLMRRALRSAG